MTEHVVSPVVVAPRELIDLVYRCARVAGIDAGAAGELAIEWMQAAEAAAGIDPFEAARSGISVRRSAFDCLNEAARSFLVTEQLLDRIAQS